MSTFTARAASAHAAPVPLMSGIAELAPRYDAFLIDSYGVLHDGSKLYPGAVDCLRRLRAAGKRVAVLTNTPRRATTVSLEIARVGVDEQCYDLLVSAGELTHATLATAFTKIGLARGQRYFYLGPERSREIVADVPFCATPSIEEADFMVITGLFAGLDRAEDYDALLTAARRRNVVAVCANPDQVAIRAGRLGLCAGAIAAHYEALGGTVRYFGKPYPDIYAMAMEQLGQIDPARIAAIGDALATDIAGARTAGLDSVLVLAGIHADELRARRLAEDPAGGRTRSMGEAAVAEMEALFARRGITPTLAVERFAWQQA